MSATEMSATETSTTETSTTEMSAHAAEALPAAVDADFVIDAAHPSLPGHFPGRPVVPGVVVLDRVLAAAEALLGTSPDALRLPQVKFVRPLLPGEPARLRLEPARGGDGGLRVKFRVALRTQDDGQEGETIATGELVVPAAPAPVAPDAPTGAA